MTDTGNIYDMPDTPDGLCKGSESPTPRYVFTFIGCELTNDQKALAENELIEEISQRLIPEVTGGTGWISLHDGRMCRYKVDISY
jgi:hypothetical protein